ncbi:MAG: FimV/HubP family polar landmark protein [Pseudomonadota bacterium]
MRKYFIVALLLVFPLFVVAQTTWGPTKTCDHLWPVAVHLSEGKSIRPQQVMVAILQANPSAFYKGNINGLLAGYVLKIPTLDEIRSIKLSYAMRLVRYQNKIWPKVFNSKRTRVRMRCVVNRSPLSLKSPKTTVQHSVNRMDRLVTQITGLQQQVFGLKQQVKAVNENNLALLQKVDELHAQNVSLKNSNLLLQKRIAQFEQMQLQYQQQKNQLEQLKAKLKQAPALMVILHQLRQSVFAGQEEQTKVQQSMNINDQHIQKVAWQPVLQKLMNVQSLYILLLVSVVLLLIVLFFLVSKRRAKPLKTHSSQSEVQDKSPVAEYVPSEEEETETVSEEEPASDSSDYQYLSGEDVIASKLDLAHAYIDMGDKNRVKRLLESVIREGNETQKKEAQSLLKKL